MGAKMVQAKGGVTQNNFTFKGRNCLFFQIVNMHKWHAHMVHVSGVIYVLYVSYNFNLPPE